MWVHAAFCCQIHQQITGGYYGLGIPILFLRGSNVQKLPDRFRSRPGFGEGKSRSDKWWKAFGQSALISVCHLLVNCYFVTTQTQL